MTQGWIFWTLAASALVLVTCSSSGERQLHLKWENSIGKDPDQDQTAVLYLPTDVMVDKTGDIYVLQKESVEKYDKDGRHVLSMNLKKGKGAGEFAGPTSLAWDEGGFLYVWDKYLTRVSKLDPKGKFISSFKVGTLFNRMALWGKGEFVFLGLSEGHIFHVYSSDGKEVRSFGSVFEPVTDVPAFATSPTEWFVRGDTIWVANPLQYEIRQYIGEKLISTIAGPDKFPRPRVRESGGSVGVGISKGIFGLAACAGRLVATVAMDVSTLDVFDTKSEQLLSRIACSPRLRSSDGHGRLYFVDETKVKVGRLE